jgi:hypothetical protein
MELVFLLQDLAQSATGPKIRFVPVSRSGRRDHRKQGTVTESAQEAGSATHRAALEPFGATFLLLSCGPSVNGRSIDLVCFGHLGHRHSFPNGGDRSNTNVIGRILGLHDNKTIQHSIIMSMEMLQYYCTWLYEDEIIAEVWRNRDAYVQEHQHDLKKIVEDLRRWEKEHPSKVVDRRRQRR